MIIRTQDGTQRLKVLSSTYHPLSICFAVALAKQPMELRSYHQAIKDPKWKEAMQSEIQAFNANQTWTLVPKTMDMNLVSSKWVFKIKIQANGAIERYKTHLVTCVFTQL